MTEETLEHLKNLVSLSPGLDETYRRTLEWWDPDLSPSTCTYSDIGLRIVDDFDIYDQKTNDNIFAMIDQAVTSGYVELDEAVATGLIETLGSSAKKSGKWEQIKDRLRSKAGGYADAWFGK